MADLITDCPTCQNKLTATTLSCNHCGLQLQNQFELSVFDYLTADQKTFLLTFLKYQGNFRLLQAELNISYPTAKKKMQELLTALSLTEPTPLETEREVLDMSQFHTDATSVEASEIIKCKIKENGGRILVSSARGNTYEIRANLDGKSFSCDALPINPPYEYTVFDVMVKTMLEQGGKALKGQGRNHRLGEPHCEVTTIVGAIGKHYAGKNEGEWVFDPVFVLAAVLEWADIARNGRGYLELTPSYLMKRKNQNI